MAISFTSPAPSWFNCGSARAAGTGRPPSSIHSGNSDKKIRKAAAKWGAKDAVADVFMTRWKMNDPAGGRWLAAVLVDRLPAASSYSLRDDNIIFASPRLSSTSLSPVPPPFLSGRNKELSNQCHRLLHFFRRRRSTEANTINRPSKPIPQRHPAPVPWHYAIRLSQIWP